MEGTSEFQSFEPLVRRGIAASHGKLPLANAGGNGSVRKHLEEWLTKVVKVSHPSAIIVTLDLCDAIDEGAYDSCEAMRIDLEQRAALWIENARSHGKLDPLPERITIVIQVPKFEAWLTADWQGLATLGLQRALPAAAPENVDEEITSHISWLDHALKGGYQKRPQHAVRVAKALSPTRMAAHSRSFQKFWKEVRVAYELWSQVTGQLSYDR